ncbi:hypothetical protein SLA2020_406850 [Shorea laevis]
MATIIVAEDASVHEDAQALRKAFQGWGTDEKAIIKILGHRNATQRTQIGNLMRSFIKKILSSVLSLSCPGTLRKRCTELLAVRRAYQSRYKRSLEEDVAAHTTGDLRQLLVALVTAYRYDGQEVNERLAKSEADILHDAIKDRAFDHEEVTRILSTRSKTQLRATFNRYKDEHDTSITKNMSGDPRSNLQKALRTAIRCINDPKKYFEKLVRNAIKGVGSDEEALTRVIVTRAERDLNGIKELYYQRNTVSLDHAVAKETSGDYKAFLLTLLGKQD